MIRVLIEVLGYGVIAPAGISFAIVWLCRKLHPAGMAERYAAAAAVGIGFFAGYALMPEWAPLVPQRHWQWLPYLALWAAVVGSLSLVRGHRHTTGFHWLVFLAVAIVAAASIVPKWPDLQPRQSISIALVAAYLIALMAGLDSLPELLRGGVMLVAMAQTAGAVAILLGAEVSLIFGQLTGIAAAAVAGVCGASLLMWPNLSARGMIPVFVVLVGGFAYVGTIELDPPVPGILVAAAAPLGLWICGAGPAAKVRGWKGVAIQIAAVVVPLAVAAGWVMMRGSGEEW